MRSRRTVVTVAVSLAATGLVGAIAFGATNSFLISQAERGLQSLMLSHRGMHLYIQRVMHPALYSLKDEGQIPRELYAPEILSSSYIVREQHRLYNQVRAEQGLAPVYYKMAADNPRNPVNRADGHEEQLIAFFNAHRDQNHHHQIVQHDGKTYLEFASPFLENTAACLRCHGDRRDAPAQLQTLYAGQGGFGEKLGRIRAIESVRIPIDTEKRWAWVASAMLLAGSLVFGGLVMSNRWLSQRVKDRTLHLERETAERRRAEEALQITQFAVDSMADAVYRFDGSGSILYTNDAGARQLGYDRKEDVCGLRLWDFVDQLSASQWPERWTLLKTMGRRHLETRHRRRDGTTFPVDVYSSFMCFGGAEFSWAVVRDVTEHKQLEAQFLEAQKMEAIATLAGGIAHDFNNILGAVRGYAELAHDSIEDGCSGREDLQEIMKAADRARDVVRQILDFSRTSQRSRVALQAGAIVSEALKLLRASLPSTIVIQEKIDLRAWAWADPTGFHQIVMNLCTNAFQAMRESGGLLRIELTGPGGNADAVPADLAAGTYVRLRVSDTGPGIDPQSLRHIFEPYFTTKRASGGTGLGLSVVHGLVRSYGGEVIAVSELGKGTTFDVWLPSADAPAAAAPTADETVPTGRARVLVVDDEEGVRHVGCRMLTTLGYSAQAVSTAEEAIALLRADPAAFELVLTDQTMPRMTGLALAARLRELHPSLKVVLMSGFSEAIQDKSPSELGVHAVLSKPFTRRGLAEAVRAAVAGKAPAGTA